MIASNEARLTGKWLPSKGGVVEDETCKRIAQLVSAHLVKLGYDQSGWDELYRDPTDGRLWELIYPQSELQGGGPPELRCLTIQEATQKYGQAVVTPATRAPNPSE